MPVDVRGRGESDTACGRPQKNSDADAIQSGSMERGSLERPKPDPDRADSRKKKVRVEAAGELRETVLGVARTPRSTVA